MNQLMSRQPININLNDYDPAVCGSCKKLGKIVTSFKSISEIYIIPRTASPTGMEVTAVVTKYRCKRCGSDVLDSSGQPIVKVQI